MNASSDPELPRELAPVIETLRAQRASAEPRALDRIKAQALARHVQRRRKRRPLRAKALTALTMLGIVAGTGGVLAIAGGADQSAALSQYCPPRSRVKHGKCYPIHHHRGHRHHHHHHHHH